MTATPTSVPVIEKGKTPVPQTAPGTKSKWPFGALLGRGKEIDLAVTAVCMGEEGASGGFVSLYSSLDAKDKAKALSKLAREFSEQTGDLVIDADRAVTGANIADAMGQLAQSGALKGVHGDADAAIKKISTRLSLIIEDETECNIYQKHPELRLSCAKAVWALSDDEDKPAQERTLSHFATIGQLQDWALETAMAGGYNGVIEQCCYIDRLVPRIIGQDDGRAIMLDVVSANDNGERKAMLKAISNADGPAAMLLFTKLVETPKMAIDVLECAAVSAAVTRADELALVSKLWENGDDEILEKALHYGGTRAMVIRHLVGLNEGGELVMRAVEDSGEEGTMLRILASLGEDRIGHILAKWFEKRETRDYFFRTAAMLGVTSPELQHAVFTFTQVSGTDKSERKAARKAFTAMMDAEAERKIAAVSAAFSVLFKGLSNAIDKEPVQSNVCVSASAQSEGIMAKATGIFQYEKATGNTPGPEEQAKMKIAALQAGLNGLLSALSELLHVKARLASVKGTEFGAEAGDYKLHALMDLGLGSASTGMDGIGVSVPSPVPGTPRPESV